MARFIFKLDGILRHRERIEQERQRDLAIAQAEMARLEGQLRQFQGELQHSSADVRDNHLVGKLDMLYLAAHRRYMLGMNRKVLALAQTMAAQKQKVDQARVALAEASLQKKMLEKLRERHHERWRADQSRAEANALDELTTQMSYQTSLAQAEEAP
ncbi:MAG TPA: flagellar export protein FliJ [Tepidisphaeraceae bacterium]|nr:flagellar export protein FliJ [Tepidisphaeraceae bacterium]